jgi:hypothetical protein
MCANCALIQPSSATGARIMAAILVGGALRGEDPRQGGGIGGNKIIIRDSGIEGFEYLRLGISE